MDSVCSSIADDPDVLQCAQGQRSSCNPAPLPLRDSLRLQHRRVKVHDGGELPD
jgi:hypothetical protein